MNTKEELETRLIYLDIPKKYHKGLYNFVLEKQIELLEEIKKEFENPESERFGDTYSFERGKSVGRNELKREQIELLDSKILSIKKEK